MFEFWKHLQWLKSLCLFFARLFWPLEWRPTHEHLFCYFVIVAVLAFLFFRCPAVSLDFTIRWERLLCFKAISFVCAMVCTCVCDRICFTFCEMIDDCPISSIVRQCGLYLHCTILSSIFPLIVFVGRSNGGLQFLLAQWKCIKPSTFSKRRERCHLLCFCKYGV